MPASPSKQTQKVLSNDLKQNDFVYGSVVQRQAKTRKILTVLFSTVSILLIVASVWTANSNESKALDLESRITMKNRELLNIQKKLNTEKNMTKTIVNTISKEVDRLEQEAFKWSEALAELERLTGANIILGKVSGHFLGKDIEKDGANSMSVTGETTSYSQIASYIELLESSPFFSNVNFSSSAKSRSEGKPTKADIKLTFDLINTRLNDDAADRVIVGYSDQSDAAIEQAPLAQAPGQPIWEEGKMPVTNAISPERGTIHLEWANEANVYMYHIYQKAKDAEGKVTDEVNKVASVKRQTGLTTGYDIIVDDPLTEYEFVVQAQSQVGVFSKPSRTTTRSGGVVRQLESVQNVELVRQPQSPKQSNNNVSFKELVQVSWDEVSDPEFYAYKIYIGTVKQDLNLIATITDKDQTLFKKSFPYSKAPLYTRVVYEDKNGNLSN